MGAKTARPNQEPVKLDIEGGSISARDIKAAREVAESAMTDAAFHRLASRVRDEMRDADSSLTRATRDRDRATPRDVSHVDSPRLRTQLPSPEGFRYSLSGRQRKIRSATKNKVMAAAPKSQRRAIRSMLTEDDPGEWRRVNSALHRAAGDVQELSDADRATVQRLDRVIQSYEQENDRMHTVYVAVKLPDTHRDVGDPDEVPDNLQPGSTVSFDQFTIARHNMHETPGHDSDRYLMFEITTSRGMYFGHSDTVEDTTHLLPRGMTCEVVSAAESIYQVGNSYGNRLVLQLRELT
ncbi:hypothetical protein H7J87_11725 [Mycolicibacterium wolinskyi]|uniref:ADP ribosyltransferase domain-containing protein n=1 Tax=Mycolicibacterium wolinskyi TaxID=59750 RepID=A0A1X2FJ65_9MYCO|nr:MULTISPECIES: hypothetical protein [Mycolicibacterium]MCV7285999.1 hypothetical protein [Mycolicibacterium wolinskyi]MCV7296195.1 hypothetical protein [Mycolicibacterium goodii]ORX18427.1 hypothetical protein AWC31_14075 [Mycolicibacterium wolinskyi]